MQDQPDEPKHQQNWKTIKKAKQPDQHTSFHLDSWHFSLSSFKSDSQADLQGLPHPSRKDRAELLVDYLGLSESQIVRAAERLDADGKHAMAADLLESAEAKFPGSDSLKRAKRFAYLKLMEKHQNTDPFKFIIYSSRIGEQTPQINAAR